MFDSNGSPQRDNRHHRRSRSRSPVSPGCARETLAEREERRVAEAAVPVWPPAEQPCAAPADPEPSAKEPVPTEETTPAAQAANPAAPPPEGAPGRTGSWDRSTSKPRHGPNRSRRGARQAGGAGGGPGAGPERLAGGRRSRSGGQGGREVPRPHQPQPHPHKLPQAVPPQGRLP